MSCEITNSLKSNKKLYALFLDLISRSKREPGRCLHWKNQRQRPTELHQKRSPRLHLTVENNKRYLYVKNLLFALSESATYKSCKSILNNCLDKSCVNVTHLYRAERVLLFCNRGDNFWDWEEDEESESETSSQSSSSSYLIESCNSTPVSYEQEPS